MQTSSFSWFRLFEFSIFIDGFLNQPIFGVFRVFPHSFLEYRRFEGSFLCLLRLKLPASFSLLYPLLYIIYVLTSSLTDTYNPAFFRLIFISLLILFSRLFFFVVKKLFSAFTSLFYRNCILIFSCSLAFVNNFLISYFFLVGET